MWVKEESERARRRSWPPPSRVVPSRWMAGGEEDFGGDMAVGKEMLDVGLERVVVETDVRLMQDLTGFPSIYMHTNFPRRMTKSDVAKAELGTMGYLISFSSVLSL